MSEPARKRPGVPAAGWSAVLSVLSVVALEPASASATETGPAAPVVAGFERAAADPKPAMVESGLLLLGELNCVSCHRAEAAFAAHVVGKRAPVLDEVGSRVEPDHLRAFLSAPHETKPGTTMPDVLSGLPGAERAEAVEALTHLLASTGRLTRGGVSRRAVEAGRKLYGQVGCAVCHGPREAKPGEPAALPAEATASVPLGPLESKYTVDGLAAFLLDPLKARPSGRMPGLRLKPEEANALAQYLLKDRAGGPRPNMQFRYYELAKAPEKLPDFSALEPAASGRSEGLDVSVAARKTNIALRFDGFFRVEREGRYTFFLHSDDGSTLSVDGELVVDHDGVHAPSEKRAVVVLNAGSHRISVAYFNAGSGAELDAEVQGPGLRRQPVAGLVSPTDAPPTAEGGGGKAAGRFAADPVLVKAGRDVFARVGCASCHQLNAGGGPVGAASKAPDLAALVPLRGCLAGTPGASVPRFDLSGRQRVALAAAVEAVATLSTRKPTPPESAALAMSALNCYACHQRDGRGGVEPARDPFFATTQREMGDEGRLPPPLDGVGAKLNPAYLEQVLADGAKDRPYMLTRMPRFGAANAAALAAAFGALDHVDPVPEPEFEESPRRVKSDGRFLVGGMALGCVKCHTFKGSEAEGVQAIDMTLMTRRLRRDWFHRYVVDPPAFRPGTRMPTGWPDGKSMLPKVLGGETVRQVEAVWRFLADGRAAAEPYGLGREPMPLFPAGEAVIYRNFIEGGGPRAIGVGYPEKANLAFDPNGLRLALIWQGGFIDASRHWAGRGVGFQPPMGENVVALPAGPPFASLSSLANPWPSQSSRDLGYRFRGYRVSADQRPTFLYEFGATRVEDRPDAVAGPKAAGLRRTLKLTTDAPADDLYFRAAVGESVSPQGGGWFLVNGEWRVRIEAASEPVIRSSGGKAELLVPVKFAEKAATVVEQFEW